MSLDMKSRLRELSLDWMFVTSNDFKYAADHIEALEAAITKKDAALLAAASALRKLDYWFDTDPEILDAMTDDERAAHLRMHAIVRAALAAMEESK